MIGKFPWTATIKSKIISEIEAEVKRRDVQKITEKTAINRKQNTEVATILFPIIQKIEKFSENFIKQKLKNL